MCVPTYFFFLQLKTAVQKSKAPHRQANAEQNVKNIVTETIENPQYLSFTDFVKKRKIQEAKALGRRRSRSIEKEMYDNDLSLYDEEEENTQIDDFPFKV